MKKAGILSLFLMQWTMLGCLKSESMQTLPARQPELYTDVVASEPAILLEPMEAPKTKVSLSKKIGRCVYGGLWGAMPGMISGVTSAKLLGKITKKNNAFEWPAVITFAAFGTVYGCIKRVID